MPGNEQIFNGLLIDGEVAHQIEIRHASTHSIYVLILSDVQYNNGQSFSDIIFKIKEQEFNLGPCRLMVEPNIEGLNGRILFENKIYDFSQLFSNGKVITVDESFRNLPVVLSHKEEIYPKFKEYSADLNYDLNVFREYFDRIDAACQNDPIFVQESIQHLLIESQGNRLIDYLDLKLEELADLVAAFGPKEHQRHGYYFRKQLWNVIRQAPVMARANLKPRGYAGDSEMMTMIYERICQGETSFAKILHKYAIEHAASQAVRNRCDLIAEMINGHLQKQNNPKYEIKILSLACGPAYEIQNILQEKSITDCYHFTFLDQDARALQEAAERINKQEQKLNTRVKAKFINESVRTMIFGKNLKEKWGQFDFIYSMGLFDYLTPPVAKILTHKMFDLLKPNGELVVGNYHVGNHSKLYMEYWLDWVLYYRTEDEFKALLQDAPEAQINVYYENTGSQMFLHAIKKE